MPDDESPSGRHEPGLGDSTQYGGLARPRDSMSLLQDLVEHSLDDDYYTVSRPSAGSDDGAGRSRRWMTVAAVAGFAVVVTIAAAQTRANEPQEADERATLIEQIEERKQDIDEKQAAAGDLRSEVATLREKRPDEAVGDRVARQRLTTGVVAASGPGVRVVVDNAEDEAGGEGRVSDRDLQLLVNGLWLAGAEAIAINGHRLTTLSAIRFAGEAITVNYKSVSAPYSVDVIGDPKTLQARFLETAAGQTWSNLRKNFGLRFDMTSKQEVELPAAPNKRGQVRVAERIRKSQS